MINSRAVVVSFVLYYYDVFVLLQAGVCVLIGVITTMLIVEVLYLLRRDMYTSSVEMKEEEASPRDEKADTSQSGGEEDGEKEINRLFAGK